MRTIDGIRRGWWLQVLAAGALAAGCAPTDEDVDKDDTETDETSESDDTDETDDTDATSDRIGMVTTNDHARDPHGPKIDTIMPVYHLPFAYIPAPETYASREDYDIDVALFGPLQIDAITAVGVYAWGLDYYARAEAARTKTEARLAEIEVEGPRNRYTGAEVNYALLLTLLGEFQVTIDRYGDDGPLHEMIDEEPELAGAVSYSLLKLGRYEEARAYAGRFRAEEPARLNDATWMIFMTDLLIYGEDFYENFSSVYSVDNLKELFPNTTGEFPFEDVTDENGIDRIGGTGCMSFADFDGDGWDDLYWERKWLHPEMYLIKESGTSFEPIPLENFAATNTTDVMLVPADIDNDGDLDYVKHGCNFYGGCPVSVGINDGDAKFTPVEDHGLNNSNPAQGAGTVISFADYDLDGFVDVAIADALGRTRLNRNLDGTGKFEETTIAANALGPGGDGEWGAIGVSWGDINNDGYPDLFHQGTFFSRLLLNNKDGTFTDVTEAAGVAQDPAFHRGYMAFFFDYDNDGLLDIFQGTYVQFGADETGGLESVCSCAQVLTEEGFAPELLQRAATIFRNKGDGTFEDMRADTKFPAFAVMGANHADWNNDGFQDVVFGLGGPFIYQIEPYFFYQSNGDGTYTNLTPIWEFGLWGKGHGTAFSDYDNDGDLDVALNSGGFQPGDFWPSSLLRNKGNDNHWIRVRLNAGKEGTNRSAIGAKVRIYYGDGKEQVQELWAGVGFGANNSSDLHFGLGTHETVSKIVVEWPNADGNVTTLTETFDADQFLIVNEVANDWGPVIR